MIILSTCKEGFEKVLAREVATFGLNPKAEGKGWVLSEGDAVVPFTQGGICFACEILKDPVHLSADSLKGLIEEITKNFTAHLGDKEVNAPWPVQFFSSGDEKLIHHAASLEKRWSEAFRKRMSRVAKLAQEGIPAGQMFREGLFVLSQISIRPMFLSRLSPRASSA